MQEIPIVLIGHKDHGKSTLIGRLILDSGSVKESRVKEVKEVDESAGQKFELAHLVDSFKEEREREMTIDTTRTVLKGKERNYQLIDVPGHSELISQMLTGAAGAQAALLLVSIEEGIKEQTHQHLEIAKLLGIEQLGVVVNKMDKIGYQKDVFDEIVENLKKILNEIGYSSESIHFFPVSAWEGENVIKKSEKTPWYQGGTLMEFLENKIKTPESFANLPLAFLVQDKYSEEVGEILVGKIETGKLIKGEEILFLPERKKSKIKEIKDSEKILEKAKAGQNLGITLSDNLDIKRGAVGVISDSNLKVADTLSGEIFWIEKPSQRSLILECGTAQVEGELEKPKLINQGEKTLYQISLKKPIVTAPKSKTILGKIVLKDRGKIIAVGNIV
jgi:small GTP-binding protein